jgi:hypothetical protein
VNACLSSHGMKGMFVFAIFYFPPLYEFYVEVCEPRAFNIHSSTSTFSHLFSFLTHVLSFLNLFRATRCQTPNLLAILTHLSFIMWSLGMWQHIVLYMDTHVSEEHTASIFRLAPCSLGDGYKHFGGICCIHLQSCTMFLVHEYKHFGGISSRSRWPGRCKQHLPAKRLYPMNCCGYSLSISSCLVFLISLLKSFLSLHIHYTYVPD